MKVKPQTRAFLSKIGRKGAKSKMQTTTPEQRKEIAKQAARARWDRMRASEEEQAWDRWRKASS